MTGTAQPRFWRPGRADWPALVIIALLPLYIALPELLGVLHSNPMLYVGELARRLGPGPLPGAPVPFIDPNGGFTTQALG